MEVPRECDGLPVELCLEVYTNALLAVDSLPRDPLPLAALSPLLLFSISVMSTNIWWEMSTESLLGQLVLDFSPFHRICHI